MSDASMTPDDKAALLALADRVEALTGPCVAMDGAIVLLTASPRFDCDFPFPDTSPRYTASLDAAMTLVPEGLRLQIGEWDDEKHLRPRGPWQAILTKPGCSSGFGDMLGSRCEHAATPALALTAAALRAKAAS